MNNQIKKKIKVGLIIDEFFGGANTAFGGYGFLARRLIAKYLPNDEFQVDVLLGKGKKYFLAEEYNVDHIKAYRLPKKRWFAKKWLKKQNYDLYLSIELTFNYVLENELDRNKKLILWIQDPRPQYEWDEISTVKIFPETNYYDQKIYDLVHQLYVEKRVRFISQANFLNKKAIDLYKLDSNTPIKLFHNPIEIDYNFELLNHPKKNMIIFLGRIESVKRGWLFCEIARKMPEYEFYMLGQTFRESDKNSVIMSQYENIKNLHFAGHVDGIEKENFLKDAKILVNTSIHEALPISFLEALSYGTLLVSNRNPENLTKKFGYYVGDVLGDGFEKVDDYIFGIQQLLQDEMKRESLAQEAINYVKSNHNINDFTINMRKLIKNELNIN